MSEDIEVRPRLPEVPTTEAFSGILGRYMWVTAGEMDTMAGTLRIEGNLKPGPDGEAQWSEDPAVLRRSFLDSLDAVIAILDRLGVKWYKHPDVAIRSEIRRQLNGSQTFAALECRVKLHIIAPR